MIRRLFPLFFVALMVACSSSSSDVADVTNDTASDGDLTTENDVPISQCVVGQECDDGDPCTSDDSCVEGVCTGTPIECDSLTCAAAVCNSEGKCEAGEITDGWCLINNECVEEGAADPEETCLVCDPTVSQTEFSKAADGTACEDGNICTEADACENGVCVKTNPPTCADGVMCTDDVCDPVEGCIRTPNHEMCDDDNPCTLDECDMVLGCTNTPDDSLFCGDGDVCTVNDRCVDGECITDGLMDCADDNICTDEFCHPSFGCLYVFNEEPCSDEASCTVNDICHYGRCEGEEEFYSCPPCDLEFSTTSFKINSLRMGAGGHPGEALNVDNDLKTCSPNEDCEQGLDNTLSFAGELLNDMLAENISLEAESPAIILVEMDNPKFDGTPFNMTLYYGGVDPSAPDCDYQNTVCKYRVSPSNFNDLCQPYIQFTNAVIQDNVLTAGGSGNVFPYQMYFAGGGTAEAVLFNAMVQADILTDEAGNIETFTGVIGGAVTPENLSGVVEAIPAEFFPGGSKDAVLGLIAMVPMDIDVNGDGEYDSLSLSFVVGSIKADIVPYYY